MGWSWEASEEMTFELRVEGGEFRKSVPGRGNGIAISDEPMLSRNGNSSSVGEGGSQSRVGVGDVDGRPGWRGGGG